MAGRKGWLKANWKCEVLFLPRHLGVGVAGDRRLSVTQKGWLIFCINRATTKPISDVNWEHSHMCRNPFVNTISVSSYVLTFFLLWLFDPSHHWLVGIECKSPSTQCQQKKRKHATPPRGLSCPGGYYRCRYTPPKSAEKINEIIYRKILFVNPNKNIL